ncbi:MAG: thiamine pyrophosphate-binding protein [Acetobacteraceae bacterium]|nr:thiamine pyrophosphate-binding protein [Acetobacteraceae bacterium]
MNQIERRKPRVTARSGGRILAEALVAQGISYVFAVPGESYLDVLDGLYEVRQKLHLITCRFEAGAAHMAEAYGKLTGRPAAAMVTRGPGACHAAIGVHVAQQDSTPMLLFVGQIPFSETDRESFQEVDYRRMFGPIAKWVTQIDQADRIPELVAHAVDLTTSGRPGPVVIALSEEMQRQIADAEEIRPGPITVANPDPDALARMHTMLSQASKPVVVLGGSCWSESGRDAIRSFLQGNNLPVAVSFRRQALYDGTSANYIGDLGVGSDPALVTKIKEADLVLAIGTRLGEAATQGYTLLQPTDGVSLIHVYPDPTEIGRVSRPELGIVSDVNAFAATVSHMEPLQISWNEWTHELRRLREEGREIPEYKGALNVARALRELEQLLPQDAILTTDAGNFATWPTRFMNFRDRQRYIGPTNGAMGYGVPAAVGAKIAFPDRMVVCFVGDGGFLMTGQDIATAFHHGVAPIVLLFNNQMYGTIRMHQEQTFPGRVSGTALTNPDFAKFIEAFGGYGEVVSATEQFAPAFRRAAESGRPALLELRMNPEQITTRATISDLRAGARKPATNRPPASKRLTQGGGMQRGKKR